MKGLDKQRLDKRKAQTLNWQDAAVIALGREAISSPQRLPSSSHLLASLKTGLGEVGALL